MNTSLRLELFVRDLAGSVRFYRDVLRFEIDELQSGYVSMRRGLVVLGLGPQAKLPASHHFAKRLREKASGSRSCWRSRTSTLS